MKDNEKIEIMYWSEEDDLILKENYGKIQNRQIRDKYFPNRSIPSIGKRGRRLGLKSDLLMTEQQKQNLSNIKKEYYANPKNKEQLEKVTKLLNKYREKNNPMKNPKIAKGVADKLRGVPKSEEHKKRLSLAKLKFGSWSNHSEESKRLIGLAHKGKIVSKESRRKISETRKRLGLAKGDKNAMKKSEARRKISEKFKGRINNWVHGNKNPKWSGGRFSKYYGSNWGNQRKLTRERAKGKCEICLKETNRKLDVHHIKPFRVCVLGYLEQNKQTKQISYYDLIEKVSLISNHLNNLKALCKSCHTTEEFKLHETYKRIFKEDYKKFIKSNNIFIENDK